jgi:hypothetical protein
MPRKRHTPEEIVSKLRQVDVLVSQGRSVADAVRAIGVTEVDFVTSFWTGKYSARSPRPESSSKAGDGITIPSGRMAHGATNIRRPKSSCPP